MSVNTTENLSREQQIAALEKDWATNPRWKGVKRGYSAADVVRLRGSMPIEHTLAKRGAEKLWEKVNGGAKKAGQAKGVKFIELAAEKGELSRQLAIVEDMITRKVSAIAIAPVDSAGIAPAITKAMKAGIPVVAVDTGISGADITSYVATDNIKAANVQGKWTASQVKSGDTVIYVTGDQGQ